MRLQLVESSQKENLGCALTSNLQFFRSSPVTPPVTGKITITGGVGAGLYSDLASAITVINQFTGATLTDTSLVGDVFKFTVPSGSDFSLKPQFLVGVNVSFSDSDGLVTKFGDFAFNANSGTIVLKNVEFGDDAFTGFTGTATINNLTSSSNGMQFAPLASGSTFNFTGNIGTTEGADFGNFFNSPTNVTINALASKQTSNGGGVEGDLDTATTNGATVLFNL